MLKLENWADILKKKKICHMMAMRGFTAMHGFPTMRGFPAMLIIFVSKDSAVITATQQCSEQKMEIFM